MIAPNRSQDARFAARINSFEAEISWRCMQRREERTVELGCHPETIDGLHASDERLLRPNESLQVLRQLEIVLEEFKKALELRRALRCYLEERVMN